MSAISPVPAMTPPLAVPFEWRRRTLAAGLHVLLTATLLSLVFWLLVSRWYPVSVRELAGGWMLLGILLAVDLCLGPLMTWAVFDVRKPRQALVRDMAVVAFMQVAALVYGLSVAAESRPVALVFAVDRFTLVPANGLRSQELPFARPAMRAISWRGPVLRATRTSAPGEVLDSVSLAAQGYDLAQRPTYWQDYASSRARALARARPLSVLLARHGLTQAALCARYRYLVCPGDDARFLPLESRVGDGAVLLDGQGNVLGAVALSGFD